MGRRLAAAVCALLLGGAFAQCSPERCFECQESECVASNGCYNENLVGYLPSSCVACAFAIGACRESGAGDLPGPGASPEASQVGSLDIRPELGCAHADNQQASLALGLFAGAFAAMCPCFLACYRARVDTEKSLLDASSPQVARAQASVSNKREVTAANGQGGLSTSHYVEVTFVAKQAAGQLVQVRTDFLVDQEYFLQTDHGDQVEVAYRVKDPRNGGIVEVMEEHKSEARKNLCVLGCFGSVFSTPGVALGLGNLPLTGCWWGVALTAAFVLALPVLGGLCARRMMASGSDGGGADEEAEEKLAADATTPLTA